MLETKKVNLLDVVELVEDLPEYGVKRGEQGVVVEVFDDPEEAYILEFVDESGTSSKLAYWVKPNQVKNIDADAEETYRQGIELINTGLTLEGRKKIREAVGLNPGLISTLLNLVLDNFAGSEDWDKLMSVLRFICELNPEYELARNNLVIAYLNHGIQAAKKGDVEGALQLFYPALGIRSSQEVTSWVKQNLAAAHTSLAIQAHRQAHKEANYEDALKQMKSALNNMVRACAFDPNEQTRKNLGVAYAFLGNFLLKRGDFLSAVTCFEVAEDIGLAFPELFNNHAVALAALGNLDWAIEFFDKALELEPEYSTGKANLTQVLLVKTEGKVGVKYDEEEIDIPFNQLTVMHHYQYQIAA